MKSFGSSSSDVDGNAPAASPGSLGEVGPDSRCDECGRKARESRLAPGHWMETHSGSCSKNSALQVCERCGFRHVDRDFGQVLACVMGVPLEEGREMQQRIVRRLER